MGYTFLRFTQTGWKGLAKAKISLYCLQSFAAQIIAVHSICILGPADFILKHATECCKAKVAASCSDVGDVASIEVDALTCQQEKVDLAPKPEIHKDIFSVGCVTFHDAMSKAAPALCGTAWRCETSWNARPVARGPWPVARGPAEWGTLTPRPTATMKRRVSRSDANPSAPSEIQRIQRIQRNQRKQWCTRGSVDLPSSFLISPPASCWWIPWSAYTMLR